MQNLIQLQAVRSETGPTVLFGLDQSGNIWRGPVVRADKGWVVQWTRVAEQVVSPSADNG